MVVTLLPGVPYAYTNPDRCTIVGTGDVLADGSDATYVRITSLGSSPSAVSGVIAAPLPAVDTTNLTDLGFSCRAVVEAGGRSSAQVGFWIGEAATFPDGAEEAAPSVNSTVTDLYYETWSGLGPTAATVAALGAGTASLFIDMGAALGETWSATVYEFAWLLTYSSEPPPTTGQPYRARQRLHPIAPARRWPREAWQGSSSRRVGGYR